jgi:hypothetical protein
VQRLLLALPPLGAARGAVEQEVCLLCRGWVRPQQPDVHIRICTGQNVASKMFS